MTANRIALAAAALFLVVALGLAVRGVSKPQAKAPTPIPTEAPAPKHPWADAEIEPLGAGIQSAILTDGHGAPPKPNQLVEVSWKGWLRSTEVRFENNTGFPARFVLSDAPTVDGITTALHKMKPGETRQLHLSADQAYGQTGKPPEIPGGAALVYEVTLHKVEDVREPPAQLPTSPKLQPADGYEYSILQPGQGPMPKKGDRVELHISTWLPDGTLIDSSLSRHQPVTLVVGKGDLFEGVERAIPTMRTGERRLLVVPAALAAGAKGRGPIPPNSPLHFEVELLRIL